MDCGGTSFTTRSKAVISMGWKSCLEQEQKEKPLPELSEGVRFPVDNAQVKEGKTTPPKRYTDVIFCERKEWIGIEERSSA